MLAEVLAVLAITIIAGILLWALWAINRAEGRGAKDERTRAQTAGLEQANVANTWKADAAGRADRGATLRVRDGAKPVKLPSRRPRT